jgi:dipeptidyl aminopeptidase/acylaminoacyl peptidase
VADLSKWKAPVLLVSGDDDRNVMFHETTDLAERLRERNIPTEVLVLPDEVHGFLRYESWLTIFKRASGFFEKHLKH